MGDKVDTSQQQLLKQIQRLRLQSLAGIGRSRDKNEDEKDKKKE